MGIFVPWLLDCARLTGYPTVAVSGWETRGHGGLTSLESVVLHHTAGPKAGEFPSLRVVRDGRPDLAGPLANFGLGRSGAIYVIAAGTAWHAGASTWAGMSNLNSRSLGIEAESSGTGDWTPEQRDCYPRLVAACLYYMRRDASRACAHRECAVPAGRKVDPTGIDMTAFRSVVAHYLTDPVRLIPRLATPAEDPDMDPTQDARLRRVEAAVELLVTQVCGARSTIENPWPVDATGQGLAGWSTMRYGVPHQEQLTVVQLLQAIDRQLNSGLGLANRPGGEIDNAWGHGLSTRAEVESLRGDVAHLIALVQGKAGP